MCGILAVLCPAGAPLDTDAVGRARRLVERRGKWRPQPHKGEQPARADRRRSWGRGLTQRRAGPDYAGEYAVDVRNAAGKRVGCLSLYSSVLGLRGQLTPQPMVAPATGDVLLWNGEIFDGVPVRQFRPSWAGRAPRHRR